MSSENLNSGEVFPIVSLLRRGKRTGNEKTLSPACFTETAETRETKAEFEGDKAKKQRGASAQTSKASLRNERIVTLTLEGLRCDASWPPLARRVAGLLKVALRAFGLRCRGVNWQ